MKIFDANYLNKLATEAQGNQRKRQHHSILGSGDAGSCI
jgi:hypothetical protein